MQRKIYEKINLGNKYILKEEKKPNEIKDRIEEFKKSNSINNQVFKVKEMD